jgi:hypothetical protein
VFPPPAGALLDTALAAGALRLAATPDVLLLPSELAPFAQLLPAAGASKVHPATADQPWTWHASYRRFVLQCVCRLAWL